MQQQQQQPGQIVAVSQMNSTAAARQTVVPNQQTAVNVSGVLSRIQTSAATTLAAGQIVVAQAGTLQLGGRSLTPAQLNVLKTQALMKRQEQKQEQQQQQLRAKQLLQQQQLQQNNIVAVSSGSIITVSSAAITPAGRTVVTAAAGRPGQIMRLTNVRSMTEPELKVTAPGVVQVQPGASLSTAQLQQLGIQVATP